MASASLLCRHVLHLTLCVLLLCWRIGHCIDTCRNNNLALRQIDWRVNCPTVRADLFGLSCSWLSAFCPLACGLCEETFPAARCGAAEVYANKAALARVLLDLGMCTNCTAGPHEGPTVFVLKEPGGLGIGWSSSYSTHDPQDPCLVKGVYCDRCGAAITLVVGFPSAAYVPGYFTDALWELRELDVLVTINLGSVHPDAPDMNPHGWSNMPNLTIAVVQKLMRGDMPRMSDHAVIGALNFVQNEFRGDINHLFGPPTMIFINFDQRETGTPVESLPVSSRLCAMTVMDELALRGVGMVGVFPRCIETFHRLKVLRLEGNSFEGPIAPLLASSILEDFDVSGSHLTGTIPDILSENTVMKIFVADYNLLEGRLPSIAQMTDLTQLNLRGNMLTGAAEINGNLLYADFSQNAFEEFPASWFDLENVRQLDLSDNLLTSWPAAGVFVRGTFSESGNLQGCGYPPQARPFNWPVMEVVSLSRNPLRGADVRDVFGSFSRLQRLQTLELESLGLVMDLPVEGSEQMVPIGTGVDLCSSSQQVGFPALATLRASNNSIEALRGVPWPSLQQADFSNNRLNSVHESWFMSGAPLSQDFRGNPSLRVSVSPLSSAGCSGSQLAPDPVSFLHTTVANGSICTVPCSANFILFMDSTVNASVLCRCRAGWFGEGDSCFETGRDEWSSVGSSGPSPCHNHSSTYDAQERTSPEACQCHPGYYRVYLPEIQCQPCPLNHVRSQPGGQQLSDCVPCLPGTAAGIGEVECTNCPLGTIAAGAGSGCHACEPGRYSNETGHGRSCILCPLGTYQAEVGATACVGCPVAGMETWEETQEGFVHKRGAVAHEQCGCAQGHRLDGDGCVECGVGLDCPGGLSNDVVTVAAGFYADIDYSVFRCWGSAATERCPGKRRPGEICNSDREGLTCAVCIEGMALGIDGTCLKCEGSAAAILTVGLVALVSSCIILYATVERQHSVRAYGSIRMVVLTLNILTACVQQWGVMSTLSVDWQRPVDDVLDLARAVNFNPRIMRYACTTGRTSPLSDFTARLLLPVVIVIVLTVTHLLALLTGCGLITANRRSSRHSTAPITASRSVASSIFYSRGSRTPLASMGIVATVFYISVVSMIISPFQCEEHPNGKWTLQQHKGMVCWEDPEHRAMVMIASIAILLPAAYLAFVLCVVWLYPRKVKEYDSKYVGIFEFLFQRFRPEAYWYIIIHVIRGGLFALMPIIPNILLIIFMGSLLQIIFITTTAHYMPLRFACLNVLEIVMNSVTLLVLAAALSFLNTAYEDRVIAAGCTMVTILLSILGLLLLVGYGTFIAMRDAWQVTRRGYRHFICHSPATCGALARLLKIRLQEANSSSVPLKLRAALDTDQLVSMDELLNIVREQTDQLLVMCDQDIFLRQSCLAEMAVAVVCGVKQVVLRMPMYEVPSLAVLRCVGQILDLGPLVQLGISEKLVTNAIQTVAEHHGLEMPAVLSEGAFSNMLNMLKSGHDCGVVMARPSASEEAQELLRDCSSAVLIHHDDQSDHDVVALAFLLAHLMAISPAKETGVVASPAGSGNHGASESACRARILIFSQNCFDSQSFLRMLCRLSSRRENVTPVITAVELQCRLTTLCSDKEVAHLQTLADNIKGPTEHRLADFLMDLALEICVLVSPWTMREALLVSTSQVLWKRASSTRPKLTLQRSVLQDSKLVGADDVAQVAPSMTSSKSGTHDPGAIEWNELESDDGDDSAADPTTYV